MAGPPSTVYKLNFSRRRITDDNLHTLRRELPRGDSFPYEEVDFSQNELSAGGLGQVLDVCRRCPRLRVLKLYKNQIDDGGAEGLAELCRQVPAIEEMHLSHNHFTAVGVEVLITAAEQSRPNHVSPLWLRLEQNDVGEPDAVFRDLQSRLSVCNRMDEMRCTVRVCCRKMKVHLPFFHLQRSNRAIRDVSLAFGGAPSYRVPREEAASPVYASSQSPMPKHGMLGAPSVSVGPSRSATPKTGMVSNGTACAWDVNGAGAARRIAATGPPTAGFPSAASPTAGGQQGPSPGATAAARDAAAATATQPLAAAAAGSGGASEAEPPPPAEKRVAMALSPAAVVLTTTQTAAAAGVASSQAGENSTQPWPPDLGGATPSDAQKREGTMDTLDMSPTPARQRKAPDEQQPLVAAGHRASLVLDNQGRRRILPKQLEVEGANSQFVCPLCTFVIIRPVITSCSHLFCDSCFKEWVGDQVSKQKKGMQAEGPVPLIPCPQPKCSGKLRKRDIMPMDKADATKVGAVQLLQRLRNNLQIRCVHHCEHFKYPFGQDAERLQGETGMTCKWVGDLASYEEHVRKGCPIEMHLGGPPAGVGAGALECSPVVTPTASMVSPKDAPKPPPAADPSPPKATSAGKPPAPPVSRSVGGGDGSGARQAAPQKPEGDAGETRVARFDYVPREKDTAQIALKMNDLVRIFQVTDSGWAAGVRLCRKTMQEVGDAGWFPAGYLYPPDHVATT